jgi:hypothetical protein
MNRLPKRFEDEVLSKHNIGWGEYIDRFSGVRND